MAEEMSTRKLSRKTVVTLNRALDETEDLLERDVPRNFAGTSKDSLGIVIADDV